MFILCFQTGSYPKLLLWHIFYGCSSQQWRSTCSSEGRNARHWKSRKRLYCTEFKHIKTQNTKLKLWSINALSIHHHPVNMCVPIETGSSIITSSGVQKTVQDCYAQTAPPCSHGNLWLPGVSYGVVGLHSCKVWGAIISKKTNRCFEWYYWIDPSPTNQFIWQSLQNVNVVYDKKVVLVSKVNFSPLTLQQHKVCCQWLPRPPVPAVWTWMPPCASDLSWCRTPHSLHEWQTGCHRLGNTKRHGPELLWFPPTGAHSPEKL